MTYALGVDLGTTWTGAALARDGRVTACTIDSHQTLIPSLVHVDAAGEWSFGVAARRRAESDPQGLARAFKRSFGDPVPVILSGRPVGVPELMGRLLGWVVARVAEQEDESPEIVVLSHPAHWSNDQRLALRAATRDHLDDLDVGLITEPEAIAVHFAAERTPPEGLLAVYDFGGGTFDATILSADASGFRVVGEPVGRDRVGGIDLDDQIVAWALGQIDPEAVARLDRADPVVVRALRRLRDDAVDAKEALSTEAAATLSIGLPTVRQDLRLVRSDFEELARPYIDSTIAAVREACEAAGATTEDLRLILLAGGSSRVPLVAEMLAGELGTEVSTAVHPKLAVALGAAGSTLPVRRPQPTPEPVPEAEPAPGPGGEPSLGPPPVPPSPAPQPVGPVSASGSRWGLAVAAVVGILAVAGGLWFAVLRDTGTVAQPVPTTAPEVDTTESPTVTTSAPSDTVAPLVVTDDTLARAQDAYQSGSRALQSFVQQALPTSVVETGGFRPADCADKLNSLQDNPDLGPGFANLDAFIAGFPEEAPADYVGPSGTDVGFRPRFELAADQVFEAYTSCVDDNRVEAVGDVIGAWSAALAYSCATGLFDTIAADPTVPGGPTVDCSLPGIDEVGLCQQLAKPLLEVFFSTIEAQDNEVSVCERAISPLLGTAGETGEADS